MGRADRGILAWCCFPWLAGPLRDRRLAGMMVWWADGTNESAAVKEAPMSDHNMGWRQTTTRAGLAGVLGALLLVTPAPRTTMAQTSFHVNSVQLFMSP